MRFDVPLTEGLADELLGFWHGIFGDNPDLTREILVGDEEAHNRNVLYMERSEDKPSGTCLVTTSRRLPGLGGFGEVATAPEARRTGIATRLCGQAVDEFRASGGEALFLGTGNPEALRVYHRLGWRKLAGANVMAMISGGDSPEAFLVDYFRPAGQATVRPASPRDRVPMIPLIQAPHDWQVLDANAGMRSTRYAVQNSCNGLYPRYDALTIDGRGAWLSAETADGRVIGMATARLRDSGVCQVDGFTHGDHDDVWTPLIEAAMSWGAGKSASVYQAVVSVEDEEKRERFEALGFREAGPADGFELAGRTVGGVQLERAGG